MRWSLAAWLAAFAVGSEAATIEQNMMVSVAIKCSLATEAIDMFHRRSNDTAWDATSAYSSMIGILNDYEPGSPDASRLALWSARDMYVALLQKTQVKPGVPVPNSVRQVAAGMCAMELYRFVGGDKSGLERIR